MAKEVISFQCGEFVGGRGPGDINGDCIDCGVEDPTLPTIVFPDPIDGRDPRPTPPTRPPTEPTRPTEQPGCVCRVVGGGSTTPGGEGGGGGGGTVPETGGGGATPLGPLDEVLPDICLTFEQKCFPEQGAPEHSAAFRAAVAEADATPGSSVNGEVGGECTGYAPACCQDQEGEEPCCPPIEICIPQDRDEPDVPDEATPPVGPAIICVFTQGVGNCYTAIPGPNQRTYSSMAECEALCRRPISTRPETPISVWICTEDVADFPQTGGQAVSVGKSCKLVRNDQAGANRTYRTRANCEANCDDGRDPITPGSNWGWVCEEVETTGPITGGGSVSLLGTQRECKLTNQASPDRYPTKQECEQNCQDDDPRVPLTRPETPGSAYRWYCDLGPPSTGGTGRLMSCNQRLIQGDGGYLSKAECEVYCRPEEGERDPIIPDPPTVDPPTVFPETGYTGAYRCDGPPGFNCTFIPGADATDPNTYTTLSRCREECTPDIRGPIYEVAPWVCVDLPTKHCEQDSDASFGDPSTYRNFAECQRKCIDDIKPATPRPVPETGRDPSISDDPGGTTYGTRWKCQRPSSTGGNVVGVQSVESRCVSYLGSVNEGYDTEQACYDSGCGDNRAEPPRPTGTGGSTRDKRYVCESNTSQPVLVTGSVGTCVPRWVPEGDTTGYSTIAACRAECSDPGYPLTEVDIPDTGPPGSETRYVCESTTSQPVLVTGSVGTCVPISVRPGDTTGESTMAECLAICQDPGYPLTGRDTRTVTPTIEERWVCESLFDEPVLVTGSVGTCVSRDFPEGSTAGYATQAECVAECRTIGYPETGLETPTGVTEVPDLGGWRCVTKGTPCIYDRFANKDLPGVYLDQGRCNQICRGRPESGDGGGGGSEEPKKKYRCESNPWRCVRDDLNGSYDTMMECVSRCLPRVTGGTGVVVSPTPPTSTDPPTTPTIPDSGIGEVTKDYWLCETVWVTPQCVKISIPQSDAPPANAYESRQECDEDCKIQVAPPETGPPESTRTYYLCNNVNWTCYPRTQSILAPPPPASFGDPSDCAFFCQEPEEPDPTVLTPKPVPTGDPPKCVCRATGIGSVTVEAPGYDINNPIVQPVGGFPEIVYRMCWNADCKSSEGDPEHSESYNNAKNAANSDQGPPEGYDPGPNYDQQVTIGEAGACERTLVYGSYACCQADDCCSNLCIEWRYKLEGEGYYDRRVTQRPPIQQPNTYGVECVTLGDDGAAFEGAPQAGNAGFACVPNNACVAGANCFRSHSQVNAMNACGLGCPPQVPGGGAPKPGAPPNPPQGPTQTFSCACYPRGEGKFVQWSEVEGNKRCTYKEQTWEQECVLVTTVYVPTGGDTSYYDNSDDWAQTGATAGGTVYTDEPGATGDSDYEDYYDDLEDCQNDPNCEEDTSDYPSQRDPGETGCFRGQPEADGGSPCCEERSGSDPCCPPFYLNTKTCVFLPYTQWEDDEIQVENRDSDLTSIEDDDINEGEYGEEEESYVYICTSQGSILGVRRCIKILESQQTAEVKHATMEACEEYCNIRRVTAPTEADANLPPSELLRSSNMPNAGGGVSLGDKTYTEIPEDNTGTGWDGTRVTGSQIKTGGDLLPGMSPQGPSVEETFRYGSTRPVNNTPNNLAGSRLMADDLPEPQLNMSNTFITRSNQGNKVLDLNEAEVTQYALKKRPTANIDPNIAITLKSPSPRLRKRTFKGMKNILRKRIPEALSTLLTLNNTYKSWNSNLGMIITPDVLEKSLNFKLVEQLKLLRDVGGNPVPFRKAVQLVASRFYDGTIGKFNRTAFKDLFIENRKNTSVHVIPGPSDIVNKTVALGIIDNSKRALDPSKFTGRSRQMAPLWKTMATDLDKALPCMIKGELKHIYVDDADQFKAGPDGKFTIKDGDYIEVVVKGARKNFMLTSEIDHAFIIDTRTKNQALTLLGGDTGRTLKATAASSVEFTASLNLSGEAPRDDAYILKLVTSGVNSSSTSNPDIIESTCEYQLLTTSSQTGLRDINNWVKHKINHKVIHISHEDVFIDYMVDGGGFIMTQQDVVIAGDKKAKNFPVLTRQIPFYIIMFPTNRQDMMYSTGKSTISHYTDAGQITRELVTAPSLNPKFTNPLYHPYVTHSIDNEKLDIYNQYEPEARIMSIDYLDNNSFKEGYESSGQIGMGASQPSRQPTTLRTINNIVDELVTNYDLFENRTGFPQLNTFDVMSRLTLTEFNKFVFLENSPYLMPRLRQGVIKNVKIVSPTKNDGIVFTTKTRIKNRKAGVTAGDTYYPIKSSETGQYIVPPIEITPWSGTFGNVDTADAIAKGGVRVARRSRAVPD